MVDVNGQHIQARPGRQDQQGQGVGAPGDGQNSRPAGKGGELAALEQSVSEVLTRSPGGGPGGPPNRRGASRGRASCRGASNGIAGRTVRSPPEAGEVATRRPI